MRATVGIITRNITHVIEKKSQHRVRDASYNVHDVTFSWRFLMCF